MPLGDKDVDLWACLPPAHADVMPEHVEGAHPRTSASPGVVCSAPKQDLLIAVVHSMQGFMQ